MNLSEHEEHAYLSSGASVANACPERQHLLQRLKLAFDDYSAAVRESRERGMSLDPRAEAVQSLCAHVWTELREHQEKHRCWRQREITK